MRCYECKYYKSGLNWNTCMLTGAEYFPPLNNCKLVNDDGSINEKELEKI